MKALVAYEMDPSEKRLRMAVCFLLALVVLLSVAGLKKRKPCNCGEVDGS